ncbi:MAG: DUF2330 domain-containing protein [Planctomycetota bacterium]|jgi:hypothetical protein
MRQHLVPVCLIVFSCHSALADGKFWPRRTKAYRKEVGIPSQRALIKLKDGKQTLVIETAAESESPGLGWVIPLPAVPDRMEVVRPGLFESLSFCLRPEITHHDPHRDKGVEFSIFLFLLLALWAVLAFVGPSARKGLGCVGTPLLCLGMLCVLMPRAGCSAGPPGTSASPGVRIEAEKRVGSYEVKVVTAETPQALDEWLQANGFAGLDERDEAAIADYIARKWCFFTAKLAREEGGRAAPHPISFEFPSKEAVYPLKLTGLAGSEPRFEILAVGEKQAEFPGLRTAFADTFKATGPGGNWRAANHRAAIGHPDVRRYFWDGCVVTRLEGKLTAGQMKDDVTLEWKELSPHRDHFYGRTAAKRAGSATFLLLASFLLLVTLLIFWGDCSVKERRWRGIVAVVSSIVVALIAGAVVRASLPVVDIRVEAEAPWGREFTGRWVPRRIEYAKGSEGVLDAARLREIMAGKTPGHRAPSNPYVGGLVREEASPGNYEIREEQGEARIYVCDEYAQPVLCWPARLP